MYFNPVTPRPYRRAQVQLALALIVFLLAATMPYAWLIEHFGYDDILREPSAVILAKFHAGGAPLVFAWLAFAVSAMLFVPVAICCERPLSAQWDQARGAMLLGISSAIVQSIGLLRWVLVVPPLAGAYVNPATGGATREALLVAFDTVHRYGGMLIGEMAGQLLLAGWTGLVSLQLYRSRAVPRWVAALGAATLPLWLLGQSELLHMVVPAVPSIEVVPFAFMAWEAWLWVLALSLLKRAWSERR